MIHGPMCYTLGKHEESDQSLHDLFLVRKHIQYPCQVIRPGIIQGRLVGGNLSIVYESIGAPNEVDTKGTILFLEDVGEEMYSIDRMMNKLKRVGKLDHLKGVVLGSFTSIGNMKGYFSNSVEQLILSYIPDHIPAVIGLNAGHEEENLSLIMNRPCKLVFDAQSISIDYLD